MTTSNNTEVAKPGDIIKITCPGGYNYGIECLVVDAPSGMDVRPGEIWFIGRKNHRYWVVTANYVIVKRTSSSIVGCEEHQQPEHDQNIDKRLSKARDDLLGGIFGG